MDLRQALRADSKIRLALVGSGGKTTAMFQLARQLSAPVLVSTSTHLGHEQLALADRHWVVKNAEQIDRLSEEILTTPVSLFTGPEMNNGRVAGIQPEGLAALFRLANEHDLPLLIEADGSRRLPLKAPADHEPAIPPWVNVVSVVVGFSGLFKPLSNDTVHRLERFAALTNLSLGEQLSADGLISYLEHPLGGLKNIPPGARKVVLLNQVDSQAQEIAASKIAIALLKTYDAVITASLTSHKVYSAFERTAGIILAAGASQRFGKPKVLEEWYGVPFVRRVAETAILGGLSPTIVITGELDPKIRLSLTGLPVQIVQNPDWQKGQSSSIRAGIRSVSKNIESAIFLLADQPQIPASILTELMDLHSRTLAPIIAPQVNGRRANPVLFDRRTFADLEALEGDVGGRAIFGRFPITFHLSKDERLLLDIDTPEDYRRLINLDAGEE